MSKFVQRMPQRIKASANFIPCPRCARGEFVAQRLGIGHCPGGTRLRFRAGPARSIFQVAGGRLEFMAGLPVFLALPGFSRPGTVLERKCVVGSGEILVHRFLVLDRAFLKLVALRISVAAVL